MGIFPVFVKFFPIVPFNCQFQHFLQISGKLVKIFAPFTAFFVQFCVRNGQFLCASRHLKGAMKICTDVGKTKEEIGIFLFEEGGKIGIFSQNIYP